MSDLGFPVPKPGFNLLEAFGKPVGFTPDARFAGITVPAPSPQPEPEPVSEAVEEPAPDPVTEAYTQGFVSGYEQAQAEAEERATADATAQQGLMLAFSRLDTSLEEELRLRLRDTVAALCEAAIAPLALDGDLLMRRIERAVSMLARADDERVIHLHPDDLKLVSSQLSEQWHVQPEPRLERGTIRIESQNGGVEDGPATWRLAITEALQQC